MEGQATQGPAIERPKLPLNIKGLAQFEYYGQVTKTLRLLLANGELADYDSELANRVKDAIDIVEGVCELARREGWQSWKDKNP